MDTSRSSIIQPMSMEGLYMIRMDPWDGYVTPLFNDNTFKPMIVYALYNGITRSDMHVICPSTINPVRTSKILKYMFVEPNRVFTI